MSLAKNICEVSPAWKVVCMEPKKLVMLMEEIRRSPVDMVNIPLFTKFMHVGWCRISSINSIDRWGPSWPSKEPGIRSQIPTFRWIRPGLAPWMTTQPRQCFFVDSTGVGVFGPVLLELNDDYWLVYSCCLCSEVEFDIFGQSSVRMLHSFLSKGGRSKSPGKVFIGSDVWWSALWSG